MPAKVGQSRQHLERTTFFRGGVATLSVIAHLLGSQDAGPQDRRLGERAAVGSDQAAEEDECTQEGRRVHTQSVPPRSSPTAASC